MAYKVLKDFADLQDNNHIYRAGDCYPRPDFKVSEDRVKELLTASNRLETPLIEEVYPQEDKKPLRGSEDVSEGVFKDEEPLKEEENPLARYITNDIPESFMPAPKLPTIPDDSKPKKRGRRKKDAD